jgi:hypothetical protein
MVSPVDMAMGILPVVLLLALLYVVARLVFLRGVTESRPSLESHGSLRQ